MTSVSLNCNDTMIASASKEGRIVVRKIDDEPGKISNPIVFQETETIS